MPGGDEDSALDLVGPRALPGEGGDGLFAGGGFDEVVLEGDDAHPGIAGVPDGAERGGRYRAGLLIRKLDGVRSAVDIIRRDCDPRGTIVPVSSGHYDLPPVLGPRIPRVRPGNGPHPWTVPVGV